MSAACWNDPTQFPNTAIFRGQINPAEWLRGSTEGLPNREAALEELLMLWIANINPAFKPFQALFEAAFPSSPCDAALAQAAEVLVYSGSGSRMPRS